MVVCHHFFGGAVMNFDLFLVNLILDKKVADVEMFGVLTRRLLTVDLQLDGNPVILMDYCGFRAISLGQIKRFTHIILGNAI